MSSLSHFAINADDTKRARRFYERVFGWQFDPWGPPDFFKIKTETGELPGVIGALQKRRELVAGRPTNGFECTISVLDIDRAISSIEANGGRLLMPKAVIPGVGQLVFFEDTEGNIAGAMQFE